MEYTKTHLDSTAGRVKQVLLPSGTSRYEHARHYIVTARDELDHVKAVELLPTVNQKKAYRYPDAFPYHQLYSTVTTTETFDETRIADQNGNTLIVTRDWLGRKQTYDDPDMGEWAYAYDENGNLTWQRDAKGQELSFEYDEINR